MAASDSDPQQDLISVTQDPTTKVAIITINRPKSLNSLTRPMITSLAASIRHLDADPTVSVIILTGAGTRAFCSGVDLTNAESVFKGDVKDPLSDPVAQLEICKKPVIGAINGYAVTAGFEIALACDVLVAAKDAKFIDTHAKFGIFPSWGLSQKLSRIIGPMRARQVSLTAMPVTADMAERWGLVNHVVEHSNQALPKAQEIAAAIIKNNQELVPKYKAVINDGFKLDLASALGLEKERAHSYYDGMTKDQFAMMQKFIQGDDWEHGEIFTNDDVVVGDDPEEKEDLLAPEIPAPPEFKQDGEEGEENGGLSKYGKELNKLLWEVTGLQLDAEENDGDDEQEDEASPVLALNQKEAMKHEPVVDKRPPKTEEIKPGEGGKGTPASSKSNKGKRRTTNEESELGTAASSKKPKAEPVVVKEEIPTTAFKSGITDKLSSQVAKGGQSPVATTSPVTENEIRKFILSSVTITTHELVGQFKSRLRSTDDKKSFTEVLRRTSKIQKNTSGTAYVVLK